jgi:hypothetical protein
MPQQTYAPSVFNPHEDTPPELTEMKVPAGGIELSSPQQLMVPSVFNPHTGSPALIDVNVPTGGMTALLPQQATVPSGLSPQAENPLTLIEAKFPAGGLSNSL